MAPTKEDGVKLGDDVKVQYVGMLVDGTIFEDTSKQGAPLEFTVGFGDVIEGFEKAVMGMKVGQEKTIKLPPDQAYGKPDPNLIKQVDKKELPPEEIEIGSLLGYLDDDNKEISGVITEIKGNMVTIDLNHPLAGETLVFKIKLLSKKASSKQLPTNEEESDEIA